MTILHRIAFLLLPSIFLLSSNAAPPPELTILRQQYEKAYAERVTAVHEAAVAELNAKFTAALDNAIEQAKTSGDLPTVLAFQADQKRLVEKMELPAADADNVPEALKNLRSIYREQIAKINEQHTANVTALQAPYTARLQELEATLTKNDRVEEATAVMAYRRGLGDTLSAPSIPPMAVAPVNPAPFAPATSVSSTLNNRSPGKSDDEKAAKWLIQVGGEFSIKEGGAAKHEVKSITDLPKGNYQIVTIRLDGRSTSGPVTGESLQVLSGLQGLQSFNLDYFELPDEAMTVIGTFSKLESLTLSHNSQFTGAALQSITGLQDLTQFVSYSSSINDEAIHYLAQCKGLTTLVIDGCRSMTDGCIPPLNNLPRLSHLSLQDSSVTPAGISQLTAKLQGFGINFSPDRSIAPLVAILAEKQPQLRAITIGYTIPDDSLAHLILLPNVTSVAIGGVANETLLDGLSGVPKLEKFYATSSFAISNTGLLKFVPMKKLRYLSLASPLLTEAGIAAFTKERPDVKIVR